MARLNLSELAKERLEKSHLKYKYDYNTGTGKIISTYPNYEGKEYHVCSHYGKNSDALENKIENEFPQFISSVNLFRNIVSDEMFKEFGKFYNFETGVTNLTKWNGNRSDLTIELNCDEVSIGDDELNVNVVLKKENERTCEASKLYYDISKDVAFNDEYFKSEKHVEKTINTDNFKVLGCRNYEQKYSINMERSFMFDAAINREKWLSMNNFERYEYANDKNNKIPVDIIKTREVATYSTKLPIKGLLHANTIFLDASVDYFNENGKSREFDILFDRNNKNVSEIDINKMLLDENVLDRDVYREFQINHRAENRVKNDSLLEPSEEDFINAINEVNERVQNRFDQGLTR